MREILKEIKNLLKKAGFPLAFGKGATEMAIARVEKTLCIRFPEDYREF